ncbi:MAG: peptidoglycan-binding domain-containing protein [Stellaceae bacterium]
MIRKILIGTASVLVLGIAGTALDYAADPGDTADAMSMPSASQTSNDVLPGTSFWKDDVRWAQVELHDRGLYNGSLDGVLGPQTQRAIAEFQKVNRLDRTAALDAQTWQALTGYSGVGQGSSTPPDTDHGGSTIRSFRTSDAGT